MTTWTDLQRALAPAKKPIEDGIAHASEATRELQRTLLELLARPTPPAPDVALYGAMLALFGPRATHRHPSRWLDVARFSASVGGGGFVVDVLVASRSWDHRTAGHIGIYTQELFWIEPTTAPHDYDAWLALREVLREAPELRDAAATRARAHLAERGRHTRLHRALAAALPFAADLLTDDDLRHALRADDDPGTLFTVAVLRDPSRSVAPSTDGWGIEGLPTVAELAALGGLPALAALRSHVRGLSSDPAAVDHEPYDADGKPNAPLELVSAQEHVARLGGTDALRILAEAAHREKEVLPVLLREMEREPDVARAAIDELLAARLPKLDRYRESVIRRPLLLALRSMLTTDDAPEADTLPDDLASPPWSAAKKPTKAAAEKSKKGAPKKPPRLPSFVKIEVLARPRLRDGRVLSADATRTLVELLALSDRKSPHPSLARIAEACDPASLDRFAWSLFVLWLAAGGPPKHGFGLDVLGLFGAPSTLRILGERAREWAPGGLPQRAQAAVDVLALASGIAGLAAIHRLTQARSRALAKHAQKVLTTRAKELGLTKDDLVDRLVPDLGLDADGSASFDYGSRSFAMIVDDDLAPVIVDARGKRLADLPKPRADEEELGQEALARWKALKKDVKRVLREQAPRLEQALALGRRFSVEHFEASFARHPLLQHLAQRLVWCAYDGDTRVATFGVTPDEYLDLDDHPLTLDARLSIGLLHPIEATEDELRRWGDRLADHRVVQPFPQLARPLHRHTDTERGSPALTRYSGRVVPTGKVLGLDRRGWRRDASEQGGRVYAWQKELGDDLLVVLPLDPGIYLGAPLDEPRQTLGPVSLMDEDSPRNWGDLSPLQASELLADLEDLTS